jgi:hypothetical protein
VAEPDRELVGTEAASVNADAFEVGLEERHRRLERT